jgi:saccharopine dehydrogenase-like NADP-dependent oxidoreductase
METSTKHILILGSGMMVEPLIDFLIRNPNNKIKVATNMMHTIESIMERKKNSNLSAEEIDVLQNKEKLNLLVKNSDIVISYLPPILHETIAKECLKEKKNMITTSYVSDAVYRLDKQVKEAGLVFMNEIGLDPGIDHLITHKVINDAKIRGDKIIHYESWCGALCSPEFLNNPFLYKFTWSPRGALLALKNNAKQYRNHQVIQIPSNELLTKTTNKNFQSCFNFEGYYNRDSLAYKDLYDLNDAETVIRGTIRFKGFSFVMQSLKHLNLFEDNRIDENIKNWRNYFYATVLRDEKNMNQIKTFMDENVKPGDEFFISDKLPEESTSNNENNFYIELAMFALSKFTSEYLKENNFSELFKKIYACLKYLDLFGDNNQVNN